MISKRGNILVLLLGLVAIIGIGTVEFFVWKHNIVLEPKSYGECITTKDAKILMSYPSVCVSPDGKKFTQALTDEQKKNLQPPSDVTVNWKTYSDHALGFEIKYPQSWKIQTGEKSITFYDPALPFPSPAVGGVSIINNWSLEKEKAASILRMQTVDSKGNVTYGEIINQGLFDIQNIQLSGIIGIKYKLTTQVGITNQYIVLTKGNTSFKTEYDLDSQDQRTFLIVISTFKFL